MSETLYSAEFDSQVYHDSQSKDALYKPPSQTVASQTVLGQFSPTYAPPMTTAPNSSLYNGNSRVVGNGRYVNTNSDSYFLNSNNALDSLSFSNTPTASSNLENLIKTNFEIVIGLLTELNKRVTTLEERLNTVQNSLVHYEPQKRESEQTEEPLHTLNEPPPPSSLPQQGQAPGVFNPPVVVPIQPNPNGVPPRPYNVYQSPSPQGPVGYPPPPGTFIHPGRMQGPYIAQGPPQMNYPPNFPVNQGMYNYSPFGQAPPVQNMKKN